MPRGRPCRARDFAPREPKAGKVLHADGHEIRSAHQKALNERAVLAEKVGKYARAYAELDADRGTSEPSCEVLETKVALVELFGEIRSGESAVRDGLRDAFARERV